MSREPFVTHGGSRTLKIVIVFVRETGGNWLTKFFHKKKKSFNTHRHVCLTGYNADIYFVLNAVIVICAGQCTYR